MSSQCTMLRFNRLLSGDQTYSLAKLLRIKQQLKTAALCHRGLNHIITMQKEDECKDIIIRCIQMANGMFLATGKSPWQL